MIDFVIVCKKSLPVSNAKIVLTQITFPLSVYMQYTIIRNVYCIIVTKKKPPKCTNKEKTQLLQIPTGKQQLGTYISLSKCAPRLTFDVFRKKCIAELLRILQQPNLSVFFVDLRFKYQVQA